MHYYILYILYILYLLLYILLYILLHILLYILLYILLHILLHNIAQASQIEEKYCCEINIYITGVEKGHKSVAPL